MTPTEQDNELREKIADIFDELCEPTNEFWHRDSGLHWADKVMQLITADRKRVALEARVDEINYLDDNFQENSQDWEREHPGYSTAMIPMEDYIRRLAELKAQQEEV